MHIKQSVFKGALLLVLALLSVGNLEGRIKKELRTASNGFKWYYCTEKKEAFAMSLQGEVLTPRISKDTFLGIVFTCGEDDPGFFQVKMRQDYAIISRDGLMWGTLNSGVRSHLFSEKKEYYFVDYDDDLYSIRADKLKYIGHIPKDEIPGYHKVRLGETVNGYQSVEIWVGSRVSSSSRGLTRRTDEYSYSNPQLYGKNLIVGDRFLFPIKDQIYGIAFDRGQFTCNRKEGDRTVCDLYTAAGEVEIRGLIKHFKTSLGTVFLTQDGKSNGLFVYDSDGKFSRFASGIIEEVFILDGKFLLDGGDKGGKFLVDASGKTIIPQGSGSAKYEKIVKNGSVYLASTSSYMDIYSMEGDVLIKKESGANVGEKYVYGSTWMVSTDDGRVVIPPGQGYNYIKLIETESGPLFHCMNKSYRYGVIDLTGKAVLPFEFDTLYPCGDSFFTFKSNGFYGVVDANAKVIIPTSRGYTSIGPYSSIQGTFPFTKEGYRGECDRKGKEIALIKTASPQQTSSSSPAGTASAGKEKTASSASDSSGTVKTVVEHHHDPVPMQVWSQCCVCNGSGNCHICFGEGWRYTVTGTIRCFVCGGKGKCTYCAGQGGHYEVKMY